MLIAIVALVSAAAFVRFGVMAFQGAVSTPRASAEEFSQQVTAGTIGMIISGLVLGGAMERLLP